MWIIEETPNKNKIWYSEEEYETLKQENQEALETIIELQCKYEQLQKELNNDKCRG